MFKPVISFQDSNFDLIRTKLNLDVHYIPPSSKLQLVVQLSYCDKVDTCIYDVMVQYYIRWCTCAYKDVWKYI